MTLPIAAVSTSSGLSPARSTAARMATAPRSGAGTSFSVPPKAPIAVRTGSAKTTERDVMAISSCFRMSRALGDLPSRYDGPVSGRGIGIGEFRREREARRLEAGPIVPILKRGDCHHFPLIETRQGRVDHVFGRRRDTTCPRTIPSATVRWHEPQGWRQGLTTKAVATVRASCVAAVDKIPALALRPGPSSRY